jgi:hypothetical protein
MVGKLALGLLALASSTFAADLPAITMKGSKFFFENGTQFFIKGVAYQQDTAAAGETNDLTSKFVDPLADDERCKTDIPLLAELGTNVIRTYAIDPTADHSACMKLLIQHGIYVISDLGQPALSINRDDPQWDVELFSRYKDVVDELAQYSNVIGFFAGNEVSNNNTNTEASAWVKAAVRDTKKYIKDQGHRAMGVGYAANDDTDIRVDMAQYFNCGKEEEAIDFWGYNIYSWCGQSDMQKSGYSDQAEFFSNYSVPVFFAEYGCNDPGGAAGRVFQETAALYSDEMTKVFSGGIVYMYFQEKNDFGLVTAGKNGAATKVKDFSTLKKQVLAADPKGVDSDSYSATNKASSCPGVSENWKSAEELPPTPDGDLCTCMVKSRECVQAKGLSTKKYSDIFGFICGKKPDLCKGINGNATIGAYGAYSMCADSDKLDYVLDAYYNDQNGAADACDFDGQAQVQKKSTDSTCTKQLETADDHNKEVATATSAVDSPSETGSGGDDDSFAMPGASMARVFSFGDVAVGLYMVIAVGVGATMVVL